MTPTDRTAGDAARLADTVEPRGAGAPGSRKEVGDAASSRRETPHVDENAEEGEVDNSLPANAHGTDRVPAEEQDQAIDDESMYDRRPSEDKDRPPSRSGGA